MVAVIEGGSGSGGKSGATVMVMVVVDASVP